MNLWTKRTKWYGTFYVQPAVVNEDLWAVHIQLKIHDIALVARPVLVSRLYLI